MKRLNYLFIAFASLLFAVSCKNVDYKKTKSGLLYKIYPASGKDSLIKTGDVIKFQISAKLEDSVLYSSYGKLPGYAKLQAMDKPPYNIMEVFPMLRKGDSAVTVQLVDTLMKQGVQLPPNAKKGGRLVTTIRVLEVFTVDSLAMADYNKEMEKDRPRQMKEQQDQMAKMQKDEEERASKELADLEKSGEAGKQTKAVEDYLATRKISAQKTGKGTYVAVQQPGTGAQVATGKYVKIKYTGKILTTDSTFESSVIPSLHLGVDPLIKGWNEGLLLFKEGGKGTLFIPGFLAYGSKPGPGGGIFEALKFDIEVLGVSDTPMEQPQMQQQQ